MNFNKKQKNIYIIIVLLVVILTGFLLFVKKIKEIPYAEKSNTSQVSQSQETTTETVTGLPSQTQPQESAQAEKNIPITITVGNEVVKLSIPDKTSLYDALAQAKNENKIIFTGKEYTGLGFLITSIGTLNSGGGKYLFYYVNGKQADVGVSDYIPKSNDSIVWKLE